MTPTRPACNVGVDGEEPSSPEELGRSAQPAVTKAAPGTPAHQGGGDGIRDASVSAGRAGTAFPGTRRGADSTLHPIHPLRQLVVAGSVLPVPTSQEPPLDDHPPARHLGGLQRVPTAPRAPPTPSLSDLPQSQSVPAARRGKCPTWADRRRRRAFEPRGTAVTSSPASCSEIRPASCRANGSEVPNTPKRQ